MDALYTSLFSVNSECIPGLWLNSSRYVCACCAGRNTSFMAQQEPHSEHYLFNALDDAHAACKPTQPECLMQFCGSAGGGRDR